MLDAHRILRVLYGHAQPDMRRGQAIGIPLIEIAGEQRTALGEYLEGMPVRPFHGVEHLVDEGPRHLFMEEVAHRIDEDAPWRFPGQGLDKPRRSQREIEAIPERMVPHAAEAFGKALGV